MKFLIQKIICLHCNFRTPLMVACADGHADIVQLLLDNNADYNLTDKDGRTAQEFATENNHDMYVLININ